MCVYERGGEEGTVGRGGGGHFCEVYALHYSKFRLLSKEAYSTCVFVRGGGGGKVGGSWQGGGGDFCEIYNLLSFQV